MFIALLLVGCASEQPSPLIDFFPSMDDLPNWTPTGDTEVFDRENIYDLVDGQADAFFAYGFEQVAVRSYGNAEGAMLRIEIWQVATPADAYGLFTASVSGEPVTVGQANDGDADPGRRLVFWQDRYYVEVHARQAISDADLRGAGEAVSVALPAGGERPALMDRLPPGGLVDRSAIFFHEEISIQDQLWLGGQNLLGLGAETDGVLAQYNVDSAAARLLLVRYPDAQAASAGLAALEGGQVDGLVIADAHDDLLCAVFGDIDEVTASALLAGALGAG